MSCNRLTGHVRIVNLALSSQNKKKNKNGVKIDWNNLTTLSDAKLVAFPGNDTKNLTRFELCTSYAIHSRAGDRVL